MNDDQFFDGAMFENSNQMMLIFDEEDLYETTTEDDFNILRETVILIKQKKTESLS